MHHRACAQLASMTQRRTFALNFVSHLLRSLSCALLLFLRSPPSQALRPFVADQDIVCLPPGAVLPETAHRIATVERRALAACVLHGLRSVVLHDTLDYRTRLSSLCQVSLFHPSRFFKSMRPRATSAPAQRCNARRSYLAYPCGQRRLFLHPAGAQRVNGRLFVDEKFR